MAVHPRAPVLVGVGAVSQRLDEPGAGLDDTGMIIEAVRRAVEDSSSTSIGSRIDWIGSTQGLGGLSDVGRDVAAAVGVDAHTVSAQVGIPQQTVVNRALIAIREGEISAAVVCGGEAKWRADVARRAGIDLTAERSEPVGSPDEEMIPHGEFVAVPELAIGAIAPVQQYAMIENARRAANGWDIPDHLAKTADLWHRFNLKAGANPDAAFPRRREADWIRRPGPDNRPLAFPYNKWHVSQWSVDQSAALVLCSAEVARECGVPSDRWVFPHAGLESSFSLSLSRRARIERWPAMQTLGKAASDLIGRPVCDVEHVELYSCFPAAVEVQMEELGFDPDATPTVTGGMAFAGGPFNNFVYQSTVAMVERLRADPGSMGMVTAVSGLLTKPALALWSTKAPTAGVLVADLIDEASEATAAVPLDESPNGEGVVATYTVVPVGQDPARVCAVVDLDSGQRAVAALNDPEVAGQAVVEDLIGCRVNVSGTDLSV